MAGKSTDYDTASTPVTKCHAGIVEKVAQARLARLWCGTGSGEEVGSTLDITDDSDIGYAIKFVEEFTDPLTISHNNGDSSREDGQW